MQRRLALAALLAVLCAGCASTPPRAGREGAVQQVTAAEVAFA